MVSKGLTVGDVIAALSNYPPNAPLTVLLVDHNHWTTNIMVTEDRYGVEIRVRYDN